MTRTLITLAAAAFAMSAHAGNVTGNASGHASGSWPYGSTEALSQSSAVKHGAHAMTSAKMDTDTSVVTTGDTRAMGAPAPVAAPSQWPYGSTEALSQSSATRGW